MILKLNRNKTLFILIAIVCIYFVLYNYNELKGGKIAEGIVAEKYTITNFDKEKGAETYLDNSKTYNIIIYPLLKSNSIEATAIHSEETFEKGSSVPIRYYENKSEIIYTFWSFWFTSIVTSAIVILVVLAFTFSFIDANEVVLLQLGKGGLRLTKNNNKEQTKTDLVKLKE